MRSIYKQQEKPEKIEEVDEDFSIEIDEIRWVGVMIKTSRQIMMFLIDDFQSCCESYDVKIENLYNINLEKSSIEDIYWVEDIKNDYLSCITLALQTDKGRVDIEIYNQHNGYYPHSYKIITLDYKNSGNL